MRQTIVSQLPDYIGPRRFNCMKKLPRNANDKFDRRAMLRMPESQVMMMFTGFRSHRLTLKEQRDGSFKVTLRR
jgi:hypothetical protein